MVVVGGGGGGGGSIVSERILVNTSRVLSETFPSPRICEFRHKLFFFLCMNLLEGQKRWMWERVDVVCGVLLKKIVDCVVVQSKMVFPM